MMIFLRVNEWLNRTRCRKANDGTAVRRRSRNHSTDVVTAAEELTAVPSIKYGKSRIIGQVSSGSNGDCDLFMISKHKPWPKNRCARGRGVMKHRRCYGPEF